MGLPTKEDLDELGPVCSEEERQRRKKAAKAFLASVSPKTPQGLTDAEREDITWLNAAVTGAFIPTEEEMKRMICVCGAAALRLDRIIRGEPEEASKPRYGTCKACGYRTPADRCTHCGLLDIEEDT
jgi:hypothetical protein